MCILLLSFDWGPIFKDSMTRGPTTEASVLGEVYSDDTLAGFPAPVSSACFWR